MKPSEREWMSADFLSGPFVSLPYRWISEFSSLGLSAQEFVVLVQILAASQVRQTSFLTPQELGVSCGMTHYTASEILGSLVERGFLSIGERIDENGEQSNYFDLKPLWTRMRGRDPENSSTREWRKDPISLFEEEFGRPLSGLECEQLRNWLVQDGHPEWLLVEALREAVLANKYSFKYIDRILYDWQRNRVRSRQELESYRQSYRERTKGREESAASTDSTPRSQRKAPRRAQDTATAQRDDRYSAFYQLFPDS